MNSMSVVEASGMRLWLSTHLAGVEETSLEGWKDGDHFMQWEAFAGMLA